MPNCESQEAQMTRLIEVKAGLYYTRLPYSTMGIDLAIKFLEAVKENFQEK
jgi:hypothetical protein